MVESPRGHPYSKATFIMPLNEWVFLKHTHTLLSCSLTCLLFFYSPYITENTDTHTQTHMHRHVAVICPPWLPNLVQCELWKGGGVDTNSKWVARSVCINKTNCKTNDFLRKCTSMCLLLIQEVGR